MDIEGPGVGSREPGVGFDSPTPGSRLPTPGFAAGNVPGRGRPRYPAATLKSVCARSNFRVAKQVKNFTKSGVYVVDWRLPADPDADGLRDRQRRPHRRRLPPHDPAPPDPREAVGLRVRHSRPRRCARAVLGEVLSGRDALHHLRHRDRIHDPLGRPVPAALVRRAADERGVPHGRRLVLRPRRDARVHGDPARRLRLRVEEGSPAMGLTNRPERTSVTYDPKSQEGWVTTKLDFLVNWARANSLWPMPFGTACCAIEFMATAASKFDLARFGMERMSFSPRQADVLICAGRVPFKLAPVIRRIWQQMPQPKWSIAMGACASSGGMFDNYAVVQGIDTIIPVDVYVPGCPPRPEGLLYGIMMLQEKVKRERLADTSLRHEIIPDPSSQLYIPPPLIDELSEPFGNSVHQTRSGL